MSGVYPISDSSEVKYSLANRETRQWKGGEQSCSEAARYPAKCANQNLVCLINTNGQQIALLGNLWRLEGSIKGQGRGGADKRVGVLEGNAAAGDKLSDLSGHNGRRCPGGQRDHTNTNRGIQRKTCSLTNVGLILDSIILQIHG